jgi:putative FmdB family regulatory protein
MEASDSCQHPMVTRGGPAVPIYEFKCSKCQKVFEVRGSYQERERRHKCPKCGSTRVKQAISMFSAKPPSSTF